MRTEPLTALPRSQPATEALDHRAQAARRLLGVYAALARRGEHLLQALLQGSAPKQWQHYPESDAIDAGTGYQWFYHSHSPQDRPAGREHGHVHLFARRPLWSHSLRSRAEQEFAALTGRPPQNPNTRHLLGMGLDAKGVPVSLFTVNSWVTDDLMLSAPTTRRLLNTMRLNTGHTSVDAVLECVVALCAEEIHRVLIGRDHALASRPTAGVLEEHGLEILSEIPIDLDAILCRHAPSGVT